jgi:gluconolactonase
LAAVNSPDWANHGCLNRLRRVIFLSPDRRVRANFYSGMKKFLLPALFSFVLAAHGEGVFAPDAKLQKLAGGFAFTEGPTCDAKGNLFFVDQPNDRIMKWSAAGKLTTFLQPSGRANGMMFDARGQLIACADEHNELWSISPRKKITVLAKNYETNYFNGPNDVWCAPGGGLYVTDPFYRRKWWDHQNMALTNEEVFYLHPARKILMRVTDDLKKPNGITGTPDGKTLFVSDIRDNKTWRYDIAADGALTNKIFFCALGSDGMTMDAEGNLYLTGKGVTVFDKLGKQIDHIDVPEKWSANVCFGGAEHKTLFITASESLYSIEVKFAGANAAK